MVRFVKVKVKITEKNVFSRSSTVVVKEELELRKEHRVSEFVRGAWRRAIDARQDDRLARQCSNSLDKFKGGMGKRKRLREGEVRGEAVPVNDGNAAASGSAWEGGKVIASGSETGDGGFITGWAKPSFSDHHDVNLVFQDEVRDHFSLSLFTDRLCIK